MQSNGPGVWPIDRPREMPNSGRAMNFPLNRRQFLQQSVCWTAGLLTAGARVSFAAQRSLSPNEKLNIGIIGVAHQGNYDLSNVADQNIVALCDVNDSYLAET